MELRLAIAIPIVVVMLLLIYRFPTRVKPLADGEVGRWQQRLARITTLGIACLIVLTGAAFVSGSTVAIVVAVVGVPVLLGLTLLIGGLMMLRSTAEGRGHDAALSGTIRSVDFPTWKALVPLLLLVVIVVADYRWGKVNLLGSLALVAGAVVAGGWILLQRRGGKRR